MNTLTSCLFSPQKSIFKSYINAKYIIEYNNNPSNTYTLEINKTIIKKNSTINKCQT